MQDNKSVYKIYGILFLVLAILDIVSLVVSYFSSQEQLAELADAGADTGVVTGTLIAIIAISALFAVIKLLIGTKGLKLAKGEAVTGLAGLLKFLFIFEIIALVFGIISIFSGSANWTSIADSFVTVAILFDFQKRLKAEQ